MHRQGRYCMSVECLIGSLEKPFSDVSVTLKRITSAAKNVKKYNLNSLSIPYSLNVSYSRTLNRDNERYMFM